MKLSSLILINFLYFLIFEKREPPKNYLYFKKRKPSKTSYISGNGTFQPKLQK